MPQVPTSVESAASVACPQNIRLTCQADQITLQTAAAPGTPGTGDTPGTGGAGDAPPRFTMVAYSGTAMRVEGWQHPVVVDLEGMTIPSQRRPIRFAHSAFQGIGHTERIAVDNGKLIAEGIISRDTPAAREVVISGKRGFPWQASLGAQVLKAEFVRDGAVVQANGRTFQGPLYVARQTVLGEISFVDLGADSDTTATIAAAAGGVSGPASVSDAAADASSPVSAAAPSGDDAVQRMRAQALAESQRIAAVRRICGDRHAEIEATAIAEGWDVTRTELEVLRASRPKAPMVHAFAGSGDGMVNNHVLEAACMLSAGLSNVQNLYDEQTLDAAQRRFRGGIGLQELLLEAAWANGYTGRNFRDSRNILRFAFGAYLSGGNQGGLPEVQAGFSNIDVGGILSNVANKFLLEGFFSVERVWRNICAVRNVSDFKTVTSYRLIGKDQYEQIAPGGELKHGTLGEEKYSNKADTYGLLLSIDRRDVINDDLGAITTVPRKLGRGSGLKINDVFWTTFMNNAAFFTVGSGNLLTGADTALTIDGLTKAEVAFLDQVDSDGKPIGIMPAIVLVPTALSAVGTQLFKSVELRDTTANTKFPIANPHQGKFRVEVSRYLANSHYTGSSSKAWYLLADANDLPVIEVAFLNGQESPTIETAEADFNVLGVQMRGYHDFGVALQDPRGGVRMKGEA